jgi:hypothetical protein
MQNCSGGVNQACIKAMTPKDETWKCFMAQYTEPFITSPLFGLNSIYDSWQLSQILQIPCVPPKCPDEYMKDFENYRQVKNIYYLPLVHILQPNLMCCFFLFKGVYGCSCRLYSQQSARIFL